MYQGLDKGGGGLVGSGGSGVTPYDLTDVQDVSSAEEVLIGVKRTPSGDSVRVMLSASVSPIDGSLVWSEEEDQLAVMRRVIGMSQMTSMLHDHCRNDIYEQAIAASISTFIHKYNRRPTVLDIGTGTGLLAMMCVRHGAEFVIGCEMFEALADVARAVVESNGMSDQILIVASKSSDIEALPFSPDIILSELMDSALLGEGVLLAHGDAIERFMDKSVGPIEGRVIPSQACVFGSLIESEDVLHMSTVGNSCMGGLSPRRDGVNSRSTCAHGRMIPVHWGEQLLSRGARILSDTCPLFSVQFHQCEGASHSVRIEATADGTVHGLLVWWRADLLPESDIRDNGYSYSTSPGAHAWQDHWLQVVYPLGKEGGYKCNAGDIFDVTITHDALQIWCSVDRAVTSESPSKIKKPRVEQVAQAPEPCGCGWHLLCGPERLQMLNDSVVMGKWQSGIQTVVEAYVSATKSLPGKGLFVDISDGSTLALMTASALENVGHLGDSDGKAQVVSIEKKQFSAMFYGQLISSNITAGSLSPQGCVVLDDEDGASFLSSGFTSLFEGDDSTGNSPSTQLSVVTITSECFFYQLHCLPIESALSYLYALNFIRRSPVQASRFQVCPIRAHIMVAAFCLPDLRVSHGTAGIVSGFNHDYLDDVQTGWHENLFPYKLGVYRKKILSSPTSVATLHYDRCLLEREAGDDAVVSVPTAVNVPFTVLDEEQCDCVAVWVDFDVSESEKISFCQGDNFPPYLKTSVKFFREPHMVNGRNYLQVCPRFVYGDTTVKLDFDIKSN